MKRLLALLLCAALTLGCGSTAAAAAMDGYTLPELFWGQWDSVANGGLKGAAAITASGVAPWLDPILPFTAAGDVQLRFLKEGDKYQLRFYVVDDAGKQLTSSTLFAEGESLYLKSDLLPDQVLAVNPPDAAANPSILSAILNVCMIAGPVWEDTWQEPLAPYYAELETWLNAFGSEPEIRNENGAMTMVMTYRVPQTALKEKAKDLVTRLLFDDAGLKPLLARLMNEEQVSIYLNSGLLYFYEACIDQMNLNGDLILTRELNARGETVRASASMPCPQNQWGITRATVEQGEQFWRVTLVDEKRTTELSMTETAGNAEGGTWVGQLRTSVASGSAEQPVSAKLEVKFRHATTTDEDGTTHDGTEWSFTMAPDLEAVMDDPFQAQYLDFDPLALSATLDFSRKPGAAQPVALTIQVGAKLPGADLTLKMLLRNSNSWAAETLDRASAVNIHTLTPERQAELLATFTRNAVLAMATQANAVPTTSASPTPAVTEPPVEQEITSTDLLPDTTAVPPMEGVD